MSASTTTPPAPRTSRRRWSIVAALGVAVLAGLAVIVTVVAPPSSTTAAATATGSAGAFTATDLAGQQVAVPGGKPSAVLFFSATCRTCGPVAHALAVAQQADPEANYVAVDLDPTETPADIIRFLTTNQATTLAVADNPGGRLPGGYRVTQLSTVVILGPDGHEMSRAVEPTAAQIQTAITGVAGLSGPVGAWITEHQLRVALTGAALIATTALAVAIARRGSPRAAQTDTVLDREATPL